MVLHHVAQGATALVVAGPLLHSHRFCSGDLHVGDVVAVPDRLEDRVGEAQHQDVLHRLLAEIVVDAEDLVLLGTGLHHLVEGLGAGVVGAEGLLDHHPAALAVGQQAGGGEGAAAAAVEGRRHREIEGAVAAGGALAVEVVEPFAQAHDRGRIGEVGRLVVERRSEAFPGLGIAGDGGGHRFGHAAAELLIAPGAAGAAQHGEFTGQPPLAVELEQGGHQFAVGEVTAGPEDHDALGRNHPFLPQAHPQGVGEDGLHGEVCWCLRFNQTGPPRRGAGTVCDGLCVGNRKKPAGGGLRVRSLPEIAAGVQPGSH